MKKLVMKYIAVLFLLFISFLKADVINKIVINGNQRINIDYINTLIVPIEGGVYSQEDIDRTLKLLYGSELFENVDILFQRGVLTFNLIENPVIEKIIFEGNKKIKTSNLEKEIRLQTRNTFSLSTLQTDIKRITTLYYQSGYLSAVINPVITKKENNAVDVTFSIQEGKKLSIKNLRFIGNDNFDEKVLKDIILTQEKKWYNFFSRGDIYDRNRILYDGELLRQFYLENGYPNFLVTSNFAELDTNTSFVITYLVEEGERYQFGDFTVIIKIPELQTYQSEIENSIELPKNQWFQNSVLLRETYKIQKRINDAGYQFVNVNSQMVFNDITRKVDIVFIVTEEKKVFINNINIVGNKRSLVNVVRRELRFFEGDAFSSTSADLATNNLQRTGYFSNVNFKKTPVSEGIIDVDVQVEEVSTGSISIGGGYSTVNGLQFEGGYSDTNLFGTGKYLALSTTLSEANNVYNISLSDPYFLNKNLYGSLSIYRRDSRSDNVNSSNVYEILSQGAGTSIAYNITNSLSHSIGYSYTYRKIDNVSPAASASIKEIEGTSFISVVSTGFVLDTRDSALYPKKGFRITLDTELAGAFSAGNVNYIRNTVKAIYYYNIFDQVVISFLGSAGSVEGLKGDKVNIIDKYTLGGANLRGFSSGSNYGGIGPYDTTSKETLGGQYMFRGSIQIDRPVESVKQYGLITYVFTDFGTVTDFNKTDPNIYDNAALRVSSGVGIAWRSPAGLISLDIGFPIKKQPTDSLERIFLNFGTRF